MNIKSSTKTWFQEWSALAEGRRFLRRRSSDIQLALTVAFMTPLSLWYGLHARFATDDMMNIAIYFQAGWQATVGSQFHFFNGFYRPLGGVFYLTLFDLFGLNPLPYRLVIHALLILNMVLAYHVSKRISGSRSAGLLTIALLGYHPALFNLHFDTSAVYDVLAFTCFSSTLLYYLRFRARDAQFSLRNALILSGLYICALNSKEISVTLPAIIVAYEIFYSPARRLIVPAVTLGVISCLYTLGKFYGQQPLANTPGYEPSISPMIWVEATGRQISELLMLQQSLDSYGVFAFWSFLCAAAVIGRGRSIAWATTYLFVGLLPISFIRPIRGGASLYVPLFGLALFAAVVTQAALRSILHQMRLRDGYLRRRLSYALVVAYVSFLYFSKSQIGYAWPPTQELTWSLISEMQRVRREANIKAGDTIIFLNDPFEGWDMYFIAQLVLRDRHPQFFLESKLPERRLTPAEVALAKHILQITDGRIRYISGSKVDSRGRDDH